MGLIVWLWDAKCDAVSVLRLAPTALVVYITGLRLLYPEGMSFKGTPTSSLSFMLTLFVSSPFVQHTLATCWE